MATAGIGLKLLDWSDTTGAIDVKMDESVLDEKLSFKDAMFDFLFQIGLEILNYTYY